MVSHFWEEKVGRGTGRGTSPVFEKNTGCSVIPQIKPSVFPGFHPAVFTSFFPPGFLVLMQGKTPVIGLVPSIN